MDYLSGGVLDLVKLSMVIWYLSGTFLGYISVRLDMLCFDSRKSLVY